MTGSLNQECLFFPMGTQYKHGDKYGKHNVLGSFNLTECTQKALAIFTQLYCYLCILLCTEIKFNNFMDLEEGKQFHNR